MRAALKEHLFLSDYLFVANFVSKAAASQSELDEVLHELACKFPQSYHQQTPIYLEVVSTLTNAVAAFARAGAVSK